MEWQAGNEKLTMKDVLWSGHRGSGVRVKKHDYAPTLVAMASMIPIYGPFSKTRNYKNGYASTIIFKIILHQNEILQQLGNAVNVSMINESTEFLISK